MYQKRLFIMANLIVTLSLATACSDDSPNDQGSGADTDSDADSDDDTDSDTDTDTLEAVDLSPYMTPVKHQGNRNTCSVFAATASVEYLIIKETGEEHDLSEQYNYWAGKEYTLTNDVLLAYENLDGLAGYLALMAYEYGSMLESEWPYESQSWYQTGDPGCYEVEGQPISECFTGIPPENAELAEWTTETHFVDREEMGAFIMDNEIPLVFNVMWYPEAVNSAGDFHMPSEDEMNGGGGHVILLVGYDPSTQLFKFRNSWGANWGDNGYGTMPKEYIETHYEAAQWEPLDQWDDDTEDMLIKSSSGSYAELTQGS